MKFSSEICDDGVVVEANYFLYVIHRRRLNKTYKDTKLCVEIAKAVGRRLLTTKKRIQSL